MVRFLTETSKINSNSFLGLIQVDVPHLDYDNLDLIPQKEVVYVCDYPGSILVVEKAQKFYRQKDTFTIVPFEELNTIRSKNIIIISNRQSFRLPKLSEETRVHAICVGPCDNFQKFEKLATTYKGIFNYIDKEELSCAVGSIIGAIFSTVYRDVSIELHSSTLLFSQDEQICQNIYLGDLYADEKKDILVKCHRVKRNDIHTIEYTLRAHNVLNDKVVEIRKKWFVEEGVGRRNKDVLIRWKEICVAKQLKFYNTDTTSDCFNLQGDIDLLRTVSDHGLFRRISLEYLQQRDNRSDDYVSKYYTPFRMWFSRELSKN